jgi:DNA-binding transcriptional LysR family regulator
MKRGPIITLRRLEVFVAVAERGGFRAAAQTLDMTQPSVSVHMQALEEQAGGVLFDRRRGRGVVLTELGHTFLRHARQLLADASAMTQDMSRAQTEAERRVGFACQRSLTHLLPSLLADFVGRHPEIELLTHVGSEEDIIELCRSGAVHTGLLLSNRGDHGVFSTVVGQQELVIVASREHPLAGRRCIPPAEIAACAFVGAPDKSLFGIETRALLSNVGIAPIDIVSRATEFEFLRALVMANVGIYCCVRARVAADLERGHLVALSIDAPRLLMDVRHVVADRHRMSASVKLFGQFLSSSLQAQGLA